MQAYLENRKKQQEQILKYGPIRGIMLKEVKIKNSKIKDDDDYPSSNLGGPGFADQVIHRKDIKGYGLFSDQFMGQLIGVRFTEVPLTGDKIAYLVKFYGQGSKPADALSWL